MALPTSNQPSKFQSQLATAASGLTSTSNALLNSLVILGASMSKAEIIAKLNAWLPLFAAVLTARQAYTTAVAARQAALPAMHAFFASFESALKQALGPSNLAQLAAFGITPPKARKQASPETKAIAKVKSAQTREARGTMGKKQKLAISGTPEMTVQILGPDGQPVEASSPSTTTAASSTSSAAPSVAAPEPTT